MRKLHEIMRPGFLFVVQRDATVREAVQVMTDNNVGIVLVLEGDRLVGVFSERDVVRRVVDRGLDPDRTSVGDVMTSQIVVGDPDEDSQSAMRKMDQANIRHLLVVRGPEMLSMISIRDLIRVDMQDRGEEIRFLREYLYQVPQAPARSGLGFDQLGRVLVRLVAQVRRELGAERPRLRELQPQAQHVPLLVRGGAVDKAGAGVKGRVVVDELDVAGLEVHVQP